MLLRSLLNGRGSQRPRVSGKPVPSRLAIEALEDRSLPSTFTITNLTDHGAGSLRDAVRAANASPGADAVRFAPSLRGTIRLTEGEVLMTDDLTIDGPGADRLTLSGGGLSRVVHLIGESTDVATRG